MADLPRKNCWAAAEHAGDATPDEMQHFLAGAAWDADAVRDDLRDYADHRSALEVDVECCCAASHGLTFA